MNHEPLTATEQKHLASYESETGEVLFAVAIERRRQEELRAQGKFRTTCATPDGMTNAEKLCVLAEEFGEVARHCCEEQIDPTRLDKRKLKKELIEVAAVAVAWAETLP